MNRKILNLVVLFSLIISFLSYAKVERRKLDEKYKKAISYYYDKDYAEAIAILKEIQAEDPTYRASQVRRYIKVAEGRLGRMGVKKKFIVGEPTVKEVKIKKEGELEALARESQKVLLDTYHYFSQASKKYSISEFDMTTPESTLQMAKTAYDKKEYTDAIRLANKARLQLEDLIQKKVQEKKIVSLGKIGQTPVTLNLTDADLEQTLKLIYDLTGANIVLSKGIKGRATINVKDLPLKRVLDLICEANHLKYL